MLPEPRWRLAARLLWVYDTGRACFERVLPTGRQEGGQCALLLSHTSATPSTPRVHIPGRMVRA